MKVLVSGANGQLGRSVVRRAPVEAQVIALGRQDLDVTLRDEVHEAVATHRPELLVNCAAWTDVDGHERDPVMARKINVEAPAFLAEVSDPIGVHLVHISTDFVFDGLASEPYQESYPACPVNRYGQTKLEGESAIGMAATVIRTSWLQDSEGPNMVRRVLVQLAGDGQVEVPSDRWSKPSFTNDVADVLWRLAVDRHSGVVHVTNDGVTSWADFARLVAVKAGYDPDRIRAITEADYDPPRPAKRPRFSALENRVLADLGHQPMRHNQEVMEEILGHFLEG